MNEGVKKRLRVVIPAAVILILVITGIVKHRNGHDKDRVRLSGNIEATEARMGFRVQGRIEIIHVDEGDAVKKGQVLAVLDVSDQKAALAKAEAQTAYSRAVVRELENGSRPEDVEKAHARVQQASYVLAELRKGSRTQDVEKARAEVSRAEAGLGSAEAQLAQARSDRDRFEALYKDEGISKREYEQYQTRITTGELNKILESATERTPASLDKGKRLKFYYATQVEVKPPTVVCFVNYPEAVHFSYKRYLLNQIRESTGLDKTPIKLEFRQRTGKIDFGILKDEVHRNRNKEQRDKFSKNKEQKKVERKLNAKIKMEREGDDSK